MTTTVSSIKLSSHLASLSLKSVYTMKVLAVGNVVAKGLCDMNLTG